MPPQDFILAKRYYDLALETNFEAYLPVTLSLVRLYMRSFWYSLTGGTEKNMIIWGIDDQADGQWYLGKVAGDLKNRLSDTTRELDDPDDPMAYDHNNPSYGDVSCPSLMNVCSSWTVTRTRILSSGRKIGNERNSSVLRQNTTQMEDLVLKTTLMLLRGALGTEGTTLIVRTL